MQNNVSTIQSACSLLLKASYAGWTAWLCKQILTSSRQTGKDMTGILGTGWGVLNSTDSDLLRNKTSHNK